MSTTKTKPKLIIADDHFIFRVGLELTVKTFNLFSKITHAANGEQVLSALRKEKHDMVLMDIKMTPMDGIKATGVITKEFPCTKVIALTNYKDKDVVREILKKGAAGYLVKDVEKEELKRAIMAVMSGEKYLSQEASNVLIQDMLSDKDKTGSTGKHELLHGRLEDVTFLISHEFITKEIANILNKSDRTIEKDKDKIKNIIGHRKIAGIVDYAFQYGIHKNKELIKKFKKELDRKTGER